MIYNMVCNTSIDALCIAPLIRISPLFPHHQVWLKTGGHNLSTRVANHIIENALRQSHITKQSIIISPYNSLSIGLAQIGAVKGFQVIIVVPSHIPTTQVQALTKFGADILQITTYSPRQGNTQAKHITKQLLNTHSSLWAPSFNLPSLYSTALITEIMQELSSIPDYIIATSHIPAFLNTFAQHIKQQSPHTKVFYTGIGNTSASLPLTLRKNSLSSFSKHLSHIDGIIVSDANRALHITNICPIKLGITSSINTGVSLIATEKLIKKYRISSNATILTFHHPLL